MLWPYDRAGEGGGRKDSWVQNLSRGARGGVIKWFAKLIERRIMECGANILGGGAG